MNSYSYDYNDGDVYQWDYAYDRWNSTDEATDSGDDDDDSSEMGDYYNSYDLSYYDGYYNNYYPSNASIVEEWHTTKQGAIQVVVGMSVVLSAAYF